MTFCNEMFGVPVVDYHRASAGLLIGSGTGIMMAVMDLTERFRFAVDADQCRARPDRLNDWVGVLARNGLVDLVAVAGWFSISDPRPLARALAELPVPVFAYVGGGIGIDAFENIWASHKLDDFVAAIERSATGRASGRAAAQ